MACFLAPATIAIVTIGMRKKIPQKYHIGWLNAMLWGGVVMLVVEHFTHGEIVSYPPFLTAMQNSADIPIMLRELATVGGAMIVAVFTVWVAMVLIANLVAKVQEKKILTLVK